MLGREFRLSQLIEKFNSDLQRRFYEKVQCARLEWERCQKAFKNLHLRIYILEIFMVFHMVSTITDITKRLFDAIDTNGTEMISKEELGQFFNHMGPLII